MKNRSLKILLSALEWVAGLWLSMALIAYGLALINYRVTGQSASTEYKSAVGALAWVQTDAARIRGVRIQLAGHRETFRLPAHYVTRPEGWQYIDQFLHAGVRVHIDYAEDNTILGLGLMPDNGPERAAVYTTETQVIRTHEPTAIYRDQGLPYVGLGLVTLPLLLVLTLAVRRYRKRARSSGPTAVRASPPAP